MRVIMLSKSKKCQVCYEKVVGFKELKSG